MIEVTLHIPGLAEGLAAIAEAIRKQPPAQVQFPVPEVLLQTQHSPEPETKPKVDRRRKTAEVEKPAEGDMPVPALTPVPVPKLADPESVRSEMRELMGKAMEIDLRNQNKENREKIQEILRGVHPDSNGKISGIPEDRLEDAAALLREFVRTLTPQ